MPINRWVDFLKKSFWFIPVIFAIIPFIIFFIFLEFIIPTDTSYTRYRFLLHIVSNSIIVRTLLLTIAAAVISMITISFSITIVVLSIASQQYTPRLLQNFMHQNDTKIILGIFISTFIYCLIATGLIQNNSNLAPIFTTLSFIGLLFGIFSLFAFIYFINYVIQTILLPNILENIETDITSGFEKHYPEQNNSKDLLSIIELSNYPKKLSIYSYETGYLQSINYADLINQAQVTNSIFKILYQIGDYVIENTPLLEIYSRNEILSDEVSKTISKQFSIGTERKMDNDVLFPINQIVEIALRALSPGINDSGTAINCIDVLAKALSFLSKRGPAPLTLMKDDEVRVIRPTYSYHDLVKAAFRNIYDYARTNRYVLNHLVRIIDGLIKCSNRDDFKNALIIEANIIRLYNDLSQHDRNELIRLFSKLNIPIIENPISDSLL